MKSKKILIILFLLIITGVKLNATDKRNMILPLPYQAEFKSDEFKISEKTPIIISDETLRPAAQLLADQLNQATSGKFTVSSGTDNKGAIFFSKSNPLNVPDESYRLTVNNGGVKISSPNLSGAFYGVQTLLQLMPASVEGNISINDLKVRHASVYDFPRFPYRGIHLDVARHFFPVSFIKKFIDVLAMYKLNQFHWHLTDDQGWRIEIKKYPKLTEVGSQRTQTLVGRYKTPFKYDGTPYGGYYTQDDAKEVIAYAASRGVRVIPEIEFPGHALAALTAYEELGCKDAGPYDVGMRWGIYNDVFCAGNDKVYEFMRGVLDEISDLFPSEYIHVGGDECPKIRWKGCDVCQAKIKSEGLKDEHELQSYFMHQVDNFLTTKGKKMIGWEEILEGGISPNATLMSWTGDKGGIEAAKQKHHVIMTPSTHVYLDYYQEKPESTQPLAIGGYLNLERVYSYNPVPDALTKEDEKYVLGCQGNIWTEYLQSEDKVFYMALPRMAAIAEMGWSQQNKRDYRDFERRVLGFYPRLDALNVNYFVVSPTLPDTISIENGTAIIPFNPNEGMNIYYTTDGSDPDNSSKKAEGTITIDRPGLIKYINILSNGKSGALKEIVVK
ncbi:MAG: beta-N-acetylhexosaminidase [Bacteroidales bacterium]